MNDIFNIKNIKLDSKKFHQKIVKVSDLKHPEKYIGKSDILCIRSSWELIMVKFLDTSERVLEWCSEEFVIPYISPIDNRKKNYYPDFFAQALNKNNKIRKWLLEIKPFKETIKPVIKSKYKTSTKVEAVKRFLVNQAKWHATKEFCKRNNMKFKILTERELGV